MKTPRRVFPWLAGACCLAAGAWLSAAAEDAAPAASEDGAPPTAPVQIKPRPSEIMPKATQALILGVIDTGEHLIAVGDRGEILASNDGRAWAQVPTPVRAALTAVSFADPQHGWAVGHDAVVLHTGDGGRTWTLQNFQPELQEPFLDVLALDPNHAYAVGAYGLFEQTTDGGANWTKVDAPAITGDQLHLYAIRKLGNGDLFVAGEQGTLGLSTDGGKTWSKLKSPYEGTFFGAVPRGDSGALVCGLRGNAYLSRDVRKGDWQKIDTGTTNSFFGCAALDAHRVAMVGLNGIVELVDTDAGTARNVKSPGDTPYSDAVPFKGGLVMVGVSGIQHIDSLQ
ncbi:MAG: YCF48-related protein [Sinobacteraceae bacterium]|nr:YCF48-related protein [Nevskiaceae bacterium]